MLASPPAPVGFGVCGANRRRTDLARACRQLQQNEFLVRVLRLLNCGQRSLLSRSDMVRKGGSTPQWMRMVVSQCANRLSSKLGPQIVDFQGALCFRQNMHM